MKKINFLFILSVILTGSFNFTVMKNNYQLIHGDELHLIKQEKIEKAVKKVVEFLDMAAGSTEGFDLYRVMNAYFKDLDMRYQINRCLGIPEGYSYYAKELIEADIKKDD